MELVPRDHGWSGLRRFAALAGALGLLSVLGLFFMMATAGHDARAVDVVLLVWLFAGWPLVLGLAARRLDAPGSRVGVAGVGFVAAIFMLLLTFPLPGVLAAPRMLVGGAVRGTVAEVAASRAAWAEVSPARVWAERRGHGVYSTMKDGRRTSTSVYTAPIVPELPWDGEVSLFICDDADDLAAADPGTGTIAGSLVPATDLAGDAVRMLADQGLQVGPAPRCLDPSVGGYGLTFALSVVYSLLAALTIACASAWLLVRTALGR